ncbi:type II secretory pathway protein N [Oleiphilus messinensis]|uniref:Type II secretory pathway protein N n=1 Tax=Oleiphilus messinensis TaxID=141451 RepID=A0A1Y0IAV4_9GAMM|nr:type II secretion system protein N [Oleiphilus messinensis]ARU56886.1 type II secretory pathway protein N [Oleiphilus messinensis]
MALITRNFHLVALIILVMLMVASLSYQGLNFYQDLSVEKQTKPVIETRPTNIQTNLKINIQQYNLFGNPAAQTQPKPVQQDTENLPQTNLKLTLRGVSYSDENKVASALIEGPDRKTETYQIGESIAGNTALHAVYPQRVVLSRNGVLENLYFPELSDTGFVAFEPEPDPEPEPDYSTQYAEDRASQAMEPEEESEQSPASNGLSEERKAQIREKLEELRKRMNLSRQ